MYQKDFQEYIMSEEYQNIEKDIYYLQLTNLLMQHLPKETYLSVEELLHAEILYRIEEGFKAGYFARENYKQQYLAKQ